MAAKQTQSKWKKGDLNSKKNCLKWSWGCCLSGWNKSLNAIWRSGIISWNGLETFVVKHFADKMRNSNSIWRQRSITVIFYFLTVTKCKTSWFSSVTFLLYYACFFFFHIIFFSEVKQPVSIAKTYNKSIEAMQNDTGILSENMGAVSYERLSALDSVCNIFFLGWNAIALCTSCENEKCNV